LPTQKFISESFNGARASVAGSVAGKAGNAPAGITGGVAGTGLATKAEALAGKFKGMDVSTIPGNILQGKAL
jgi:hypothetical protein